MDCIVDFHTLCKAAGGFTVELWVKIIPSLGLYIGSSNVPLFEGLKTCDVLKYL